MMRHIRRKNLVLTILAPVGEGGLFPRFFLWGRCYHIGTGGTLAKNFFPYLPYFPPPGSLPGWRSFTLWKRGGGGETVPCPWLLAADGAHSRVRRRLGVAFPGSSLKADWHLADVPLATALAPDHGHIFFLPGKKFLLFIRVVDDVRRENQAAPLWRVLGNYPELLARLPLAEPRGAPVWTSSFRVSHRLAAAMVQGGLYFAGDAAHIHSPIGARGMNLGIEDAWVFAQLVRLNRLSEYHRLRRPVDGRVVRRVELLSRVVSAESWPWLFIRTCLFPVALRLPFLQRLMIPMVTGLDHELPDLTLS
jgi:2-polyprenyl-6-methoxyphenol hydroxylase-like FAD-dependent oxidoreductase